MDILSKVKFVQQCYRLLHLTHMSHKALDAIYQQNLYGIVQGAEKSAAEVNYEAKIMTSISEIAVSISDMCSCMVYGNNEGFEKIFEQVTKESATLVTIFNEVNDAVNRSKGPGSENASDGK